MLYNQSLAYNNSFTYTGTLIINAPSLINPIILNNVTVVFGLLADYSNATTMTITSIDTEPSGIISIELLDADATALMSAEIIYISPDGELSVIS